MLFESGHFDQNHDSDKVTFAVVIGAANRVQMCRYQVIGQPQGWINRQNAFRDVVHEAGQSRSRCWPCASHEQSEGVALPDRRDARLAFWNIACSLELTEQMASI